MGLFSKLKQIGESVNAVAGAVGRSTIEDFGEPAYSLYTSMKLGDMHRRIDVTDEDGKVRYYTKSSVVTIKGKTEVMDADGNAVAHLEKRPVSLHEKHFVTIEDGRSFTLSNELFHVVKDITNIEGPGWQMRGNILGLSFNLLDEGGLQQVELERMAHQVQGQYALDVVLEPDYAVGLHDPHLLFYRQRLEVVVGASRPVDADRVLDDLPVLQREVFPLVLRHGCLLPARRGGA